MSICSKKTVEGNWMNQQTAQVLEECPEESEDGNFAFGGERVGPDHPVAGFFQRIQYAFGFNEPIGNWGLFR